MKSLPVKNVPRKQLKELPPFWQSAALSNGEMFLSHRDEIHIIQGWGLIEWTFKTKRPPVQSLFKEFPEGTIEGQMVEILKDFADRLTSCSDGNHVPLQKIGEAAEVARGFRSASRDNEIRGWLVALGKQWGPMLKPVLQGLTDSEIADKLNERFPSPNPDTVIDAKRVAELRKELNIPSGVPVGKRGKAKGPKRSGKNP